MWTRKWPPVHSYIDGNERAVLHLLYARFIAVPDEGRAIGSYHKAWHSACRRAAVLKDGDGKPVERDGQAVIVRPHLLRRIPHAFRRSACRRLIQNGIPEQIAMRLTGWRSRAMLDRYFVTNERDLAEAVSKVAALRSTTPTKPSLVPRQPEA